MDWQKIIETAISTVIGGGIAIVTLAVQNQSRDREQAQAWFHQHYVEEGIDATMSYLWMLLSLDFHFIDVANERATREEETIKQQISAMQDLVVRAEAAQIQSDLEGMRANIARSQEILSQSRPRYPLLPEYAWNLPMTALERVSQLIGSPKIRSIVIRLHPSFASAARRELADTIDADTCVALYAILASLRKVALDVKVKKRGDVHRLYKHPRFQWICSDIDQMAESQQRRGATPIVNSSPSSPLQAPE
jgi:hypothetical protein